MQVDARRARSAPESGVPDDTRGADDGPTAGRGLAPRSMSELDVTLDIRRRAALAGVVIRSPRGRWYRCWKRVLDVVVVLAIAPVVLPLVALIALVIRTTSPGPAIFRQERVAEGGRLITFCKFRTMYTDARERFPEMYDYAYSEVEFAGLYYKPAVDPRNTPFGRALRKTTLDELPNLLNVLRGECSLVGPRPELPELVRYYTPEQLAKFTVRSGVTGLAQVSGRNNLSVQEQIALDLAYVRTQSFRGDLRLIAQTIVAIFKRVGAE